MKKTQPKTGQRLGLEKNRLPAAGQHGWREPPDGVRPPRSRSGTSEVLWKEAGLLGDLGKDDGPDLDPLVKGKRHRRPALSREPAMRATLARDGPADAK